MHHGGSTERLTGAARDRLTPADVGIGHLFNAVAEAAIVGDSVTGRVVLWNDGATRLFGIPSSEAVGMLIETLVPAQLKDAHRAGLERFRATGTGSLVDQRRFVEMPAISRDGRELWVELSLISLPPPAPPGLVLALARDVTAHHEALTGVARRSEILAQQTALIDLASDPIFVRDPHGEITLWNRGAEATYGWLREDACGARAEDLLRTEYPRPLAEIEQIVATEGGWEGDLVQHTRDGRRVVVESRWAAQYDQAGGLVGFLEVNRDITGRLESQAERERLLAEAERERSYRLLFEGNPQPLWIYDVETLAFLDVNSAAVARYGYSREEFLSMTIADIRPSEDVPALVESIANLPARNRPGPRRHLTRNGTVVETEITSHAINFQGRRARFVVAEDVTENARLQDQIDQLQRLDSLGRLAGGVAHDFNNLLAVILSYAAFIAEELVDSRAGIDRLDDLERDANQIRLAAERATLLTRQLLAFARKDAAKLGAINLNSVISDVETLLRRVLGEQITLTTSLAPDLHNVLADRGQIEQVLVNLAVNARDAMAERGTLCIDTANVDVDADYAAQRPGVAIGSHVRLRVSDTGAGMPKEVIDRAFDPFFTTKATGKGTGLGLAMVYGIITRAGGRPEFYSVSGTGTTFTALLPTTDCMPIDDERVVEVANLGGTETVLVVEDEQALRAVARRILERSGYHVLTAADGQEALETASAHPGPIHLLLTDAVMPLMHGKELAEHLREVRPEVPVLFMSGYAAPEPGGTGLAGWGANFVEKPFSARGLAAKVREVLDRSTSPG